MSSEFFREAYRFVNSTGALAALPLAGNQLPPKVWFGGARSGSGGGPLVKARILKKAFPDTLFGFSVVYLLSNGLYLSDVILQRIKEKGVPLVLNQNGVFYRAWCPDGWEKENARMAGAYHTASHVFWQSEFCRRCADKFLGERTGSGEILPNAVDVSVFHPPKQRDRSESFKFLLTGKIGISTAYRLTSSISGISLARAGGLNVELHVAGAIDPEVQRVALSQIDQLSLGDVVRFSGSYSSAQAPQIYQSADAYIMTKHNDPCPNVVIEAMASGLPILYSASGGVPELVGIEAGIGLPVEESFERVVTPTDLDIAEGISALITERDTMALAARKRTVERFALSEWIERHRKVFEQLVKNGHLT